MLCIYCSKDTSYKTRQDNQGRCQSCGRAFAFEPKVSGITDRLFAFVIQDLSVNQTLFFTHKQLFYALQRKLLKSQDSTQIVLFILYLGFSIPLSIVLVTIFGDSRQSQGLQIVFVFFSLLCLYAFLFGGKYSSWPWRKQVFSIYILSSLFIVTASLFYRSWPITLLAAMIAGLGCAFAHWDRRQPIVYQPTTPLFTFQSLFERWQTAHGPIERLLSPAIRLSQGLSRKTNTDIMAYSFDRLLFCDNPDIVQFLIANHFHFEFNCAVLSGDGYPEQVYETAIGMVKNNPQLKIFALHDCSLDGLCFATQLRSKQSWIIDNNLSICDIGLMPRQVLSNPRTFFIQRKSARGFRLDNLPAELINYLKPHELNWILKGHFVDLQSLAPQHLIRILSRSLQEERMLDQIGQESMFLFGDPIVYGGLESFG